MMGTAVPEKEAIFLGSLGFGMDCSSVSLRASAGYFLMGGKMVWIASNQVCAMRS